METYVALTVHTADCERGFSLMKRIKTKLRNRLAQSTLEQLMLIAASGPELLQFDCRAALEFYLNKNKRRVETELQTPSGKRTATNTRTYDMWGVAADLESESELDFIVSASSVHVSSRRFDANFRALPFPSLSSASSASSSSSSSSVVVGDGLSSSLASSSSSSSSSRVPSTSVETLARFAYVQPTTAAIEEDDVAVQAPVAGAAIPPTIPQSRRSNRPIHHPYDRPGSIFAFYSKK
eukprot:Pompholyxophrys_punicea_v1_NODE_149_length_3194_cov_9.758203.p2 type:complete len:238 gc:universal NODE_149_length_3194_cov_9.758203:2334-3047(+)